MEEELKPCPACGSISISLAYTKPVCYCVCSYCNMYGPESMSQEEAKAAWNALPRRLKWTNEKPTQEGWYWHHIPPAFGTVIEYYDPEISDSETIGEWAGPIPEPEES